MPSPLRPSWCLTLALTLALPAAAARADIIVGNKPLPPSDKTTYPRGHDPVKFGLTSPAFDFTKSSTEPRRYTSDGPSHSLTVFNTYSPLDIKYVTLFVGLAAGTRLPQGAGAVFNPNAWP